MPRLFEIVQDAEENGLFLGEISGPLFLLQKTHGNLEMREHARTHSGGHHFKGFDLELLFHDLSVEEEDENDEFAENNENVVDDGDSKEPFETTYHMMPRLLTDKAL